jgi:peptidoglycan/xylan/chitin deacetylase (PgdA/CDA1 family)
MAGSRRLTKLLLPIFGRNYPIPKLWDFQLLANGALPSQFLRPTWVISGGKAVNTPGLSAEKLDNPTFEGTYTGGLAWPYYKGGSATPTESADAHGGSKAQQVLGAAANSEVHTNFTGVNGTWYRGSCWGKRTAGAVGNGNILIDAGALWSVGPIHKNAAYTDIIMTDRALYNGTTHFRIYNQIGAGTGDTVIVDDASIKSITFVDMFAFPRRPFTSSDVILKTKVWNQQGGAQGLACCFDNPSNPMNGLLMRYSTGATTGDAFLLDKLVNGTWTNLIAAGATNHVEGESISIEKLGTSVKIYRGAVQIGATQTVTDPTVIYNKWHGLFGSDPTHQFSGFSLVSSVPPSLPLGNVALAFDDGNDTDYTEAYAYMQPHGLIGTSFITSDFIGGVGQLTVAMMTEMYNAGWDMANHTKTHPTLSDLTEAQQEAEFIACRDALNGWGFSRGSRIVGYTPGDNADTLVAMANSGMWASKTEGLTYNPYGYWIPAFQVIVHYDWTLSEILALMDTNIVTNKTNVRLYFHKICIGAGGIDIETAKFQGIIDHIVAQGYRTITHRDTISKAVW